MSYTKRDWKFERGKFNVESDQGNRLCIGSIVANGKHYIARIENAGEDVANAHLIAQSPRMAELLKRLVKDGWNAYISEEAEEILKNMEAHNET